MSDKRLRLSLRIYPEATVRAAASAFSTVAKIVVQKDDNGRIAVTFSDCRLHPQLVVDEFANHLIPLVAGSSQ